MKNWLTKLTILTILFTAFTITQAQTQAEIEQMLRGNTNTTEEKVEENVEKSEKKVKEKKDKTKADVKTAKEEKAEKAEDTKETVKETTEEAVETVKEETKKAEETVKTETKKAKKEAKETAKEAKETEAKAKEEAKKANENAKAVEKQSKQAAKENTDNGKEKAEAAKDKATKEKSEKEANAKKMMQAPTKTKASGDYARTKFYKPLRSWIITLGASMTNPYTDIRYKDFFGTLNPKNENQYGAQFRVTKMFSGAFGLQFQAQYARLQGVVDTFVKATEDRDYLIAAGLQDGVYFQNNVWQGSFNFYWNITNTSFGLNRKYNAERRGKPMKERKFSLYTYAGIGLAGFDAHIMNLQNDLPITSANNTNANLNVRDIDGDGTTMEVVFPWAIGAKFKLGKAVDLGFEYGFNFYISDKVDGIVYNHPDRKKNDFSSHLGLTLDFKLGTKKKDKEHIEWVAPITTVFDEIGDLNKKVKRLSTDKDKDGVSDFFDKDKDTPEGVATNADGTTRDSDGDGVPDGSDLEPFSDPEVEVDEFGRALDSDGDGVPDHKDREEGTSDGQFVNFQGMTIEDNIEIPESNAGVLRGAEVPPIFFDTDLAIIKREYEDELFQAARIIKNNPGVKFVLTGHCDERGTEEYNKALGMRRAETVKQYLVDNYNIDPKQLLTDSKGKLEINSPRHHINRRVDIDVAN